jgi:hypothetical protein
MPLHKHRIPAYTHTGDMHVFAATEREQIEDAYGQGTLSPDIWLKITVATGLFTAGVPAEKDALPLTEFADKLQELRLRAESLRYQFLGRCDEDELFLVGSDKNKPDSNLSGIDKLFAILKQFFQLHLFYPVFHRHTTWSRLVQQTWYPMVLFSLLHHALNSLVAVIDFVSPEIVKFRNVDAGWMWRSWVVWITVIVREHQLPYKVSAHTRKAGAPISPFVRLIEEMQNHIPQECRRSAGIDPESLARAINRARKGMDLDCEFADLVNLDSFAAG